jgi:hypothetical protein
MQQKRKISRILFGESKKAAEDYGHPGLSELYVKTSHPGNRQTKREGRGKGEAKACF